MFAFHVSIAMQYLIIVHVRILRVIMQHDITMYVFG